MAVEVKKLKFADGVVVTAPNEEFFESGSFTVHASTGDYETVKGSVGASGDVFYNSTINQYQGNVNGTWQVLVDDAATQTITNKTIDADNNTITNLAHGSEVDNLSSGVHGVVGSIVGTSDSQTLTNKTIDGDSNTVSNIDLNTQTKSTLSIANGGTGQITQTEAFDALSPTTNLGDLIARGSGGDDVRVIVGADGQVLTADSGEVSGLGWTNPLTNPMNSVGDMIIGGASGATTRLDTPINNNSVLVSDIAGNVAWTTGVTVTSLTTNTNIVANGAISTVGGGSITSSGAVSATGNVTSGGVIIANGDISTTTGYIKRGVSAKSASYAILDNDGIEVILMTTGGSDRTVTLPTAADNAERSIKIKKVDNGSGMVILDGEGAETLDGVLTFTVPLKNDYVEVVCDGTSWHVVDFTQISTRTMFTANVGATTTAPTKGTIEADLAVWWREGNYMRIQWRYRHTTAGTAGVGSYNFTIPSGLTVDTSIVNLTTIGSDDTVHKGSVGNLYLSEIGGTSLRYVLVAQSTTLLQGRDPIHNNGWTAGGVNFSNSGYGYFMDLNIPIAEWVNSVPGQI